MNCSSSDNSFNNNSSAQVLMHLCAFCLNATARTDGLPISTSGNVTLLPDSEIPSIFGNRLFKNESCAINGIKKTISNIIFFIETYSCNEMANRARRKQTPPEEIKV